MLDNYPELKAMYSAEDDNIEVLYFEDATATFYSFSDDEPKIVKSKVVNFSKIVQHVLTVSLRALTAAGIWL